MDLAIDQYTGRLHGVVWHEIRRVVLKRDDHKCIDCGQSVTERTAHIHHRLELSEGGTNHPDNLEVRCPKCHKKKHPHMRYVI